MRLKQLVAISEKAEEPTAQRADPREFAHHLLELPEMYGFLPTHIETFFEKINAGGRMPPSPKKTGSQEQVLRGAKPPR